MYETGCETPFAKGLFSGVVRSRLRLKLDPPRDKAEGTESHQYTVHLTFTEF